MTTKKVCLELERQITQVAQVVVEVPDDFDEGDLECVATRLYEAGLARETSLRWEDSDEIDEGVHHVSTEPYEDGYPPVGYRAEYAADYHLVVTDLRRKTEL